MATATLKSRARRPVARPAGRFESTTLTFLVAEDSVGDSCATILD